MKDNIFIKSVFAEYDKIVNTVFQKRYLPYRQLLSYFEINTFEQFDHSIIGYSELNQPIYAFNIGHGAHRILIWSQMHGNESTTTKAILDLLNVFEVYRSNDFISRILNSFTIKIVPILNPDGSNLYTRFNIKQVDLNRDALNKTQKETKSFFSCLHRFKPDFCFNLHGQRTIFGVGEPSKPATVSFLAPSYDDALNINSGRKKAMYLIASSAKLLEEFIPGQIGRYDDAHNLNCFGDFIQRMNIPTILFEAGHYPDDYQRNITRKYILVSLLKMFSTISNDIKNLDDISDYFNIPMNQSHFFDIIIRNVKNTDSGFIGIQYQEILKDDDIVFKPYVKSIVELSGYRGHREIDADYQRVFINEQSTITEQMTIDTIKIGNKPLDINI